MAFASAIRANAPIGDINTTPLIDVMQVLLVIVILTIPLATNTMEYDLPAPGQTAPNALKNSLSVTVDGRVLWNGANVSDAELAGALAAVRIMRPEPEVQFRPDANAGYDRTARVLQIVKASGITRFGFVDNDKYRVFTRGR